MESTKEGAKVEWKSVPAFGEWEKQQGMPDYSLDFSKIRETRKQNKSDYSHISVGNEEELLPRSKADSDVAAAGATAQPAIHHRHSSPSGRKKIMSYFVCCTGA